MFKLHKNKPYSNLLIKLERLMHNHFHQLRLPVLYAAHFAALVLSYWLAFQIRFDFQIPVNMQVLFYKSVLLLLGVRFGAWIFSKTFSGLNRYFSLFDARRLVRANILGTVLFLAMLFAIGTGSRGVLAMAVPRGIILLEFILCTTMIIGFRYLISLTREWLILWREKSSETPVKVLLVGIGDEGVRLLREILQDPRLAMRPVGFLDDDEVIKRSTVLGVPCLGGIDKLESILSRKEADMVFINPQGKEDDQIELLKEICEEYEVSYRQLLSRHELNTYIPLLDQLDELSPQKMIGRTLNTGEDHLNRPAIEYGDLTVLVTGAAGSIGSELCRQIIDRRPARLLMLDQSESGLYVLDQEINGNGSKSERHAIICDVTNQKKIEQVFECWKPDVVYHAAAYKHVPLMENEPDEAVAVNVLGTYNLAFAAKRHGAVKFVLISTDKAVTPIGIMGKTKFAAEKIIASMNGGKCSFIGVRFGNVLNSNGSVVPLFRQQVDNGGPVTVTHPEVTRFFMTINEAVYLVLTAAEISQPGELMLLDMGKPVKILDLAKRVIRSRGLVPGKDIEIKITGMRPAEKLHEELYWQGEGVRNTIHPKISAVDLFGLSEQELNNSITRFSGAVSACDKNRVRSELQRFISSHQKTAIFKPRAKS